MGEKVERFLFIAAYFKALKISALIFKSNMISRPVHWNK
jgi:hypothetical protein